jgi:hypothetical protein
MLSPGMQVFALYLAFSWYYMSDSQTTKLRMQKQWMAKWKRCRANWPPWLLGPTSHHRPTTNCEPSLPWHPHTSQPSIQDYPKILDDIERHIVTQKKCGSKKPGNFPLLVNTMNPVLSGITDHPTLSHHISTVQRANCVSPNTILRNFPTTRREMSSAQP